MALTAFAVRSGEETLQVQMVCLDDLVAADDELRRIEALIDWEHVRATARPFYRPGGAGRLGTDPAVLVKLALVLAWRGLPSMRAVLKTAATDVSIRRFLGFGLTERLPDHSTFSHAQTCRFADSSVFEQLFTGVLRAVHRGGAGRGAAAARRCHSRRGRRRIEESARRALTLELVLRRRADVRITAG